MVQTASGDVDESVRFQEMLGWGGTTTPPAFARIEPGGRAGMVARDSAEYNLLLHREYPTGALLNREMTNWDRASDASPHYYGDNFPNCETSNFDYMRRIRRLGGKVIFEFWELPPWAKARDAAGKLTEAPEIDAYVKAMVRLLPGLAGQDRARPGDRGNSERGDAAGRELAAAWRWRCGADWMTRDSLPRKSTCTIRRSPAGAWPPAKRSGKDAAVWKTIDYAASNLYDYQSHFYDPDGFDAALAQLRRRHRGKPFLAVELCVNNGEFQSPAYRVAFAMGQLYHKVLTQLDACGVMYCWTLLNVVQPSYGWTRTLLVPDPEHGFRPAASSHQLRVFGAYSRRVRAGMWRVKAASGNPDILATAFRDAAGKRTLILLNRSVRAQKVALHWPGASFAYLETVDAQHENTVENWSGGTEVSVGPGAIVTLTNVELGKLAEDAQRA